MANGAPVNSSGSGDDTLAMVILIALMCFLIWALGGHVIRGVLLLMRWVELTPFALFSPEAARLQRMSFQAAMAAKKMDSANFMAAMNMTGAYVRWLWVLPLLWAASRQMRRRSFTTTHTMQSLLDQESHMWREVMPVARLDLISGDLRKGRWRVSETEREFVRRNQLLLPSVAKDSLGVDIPNIDEEQARQTLACQLGPVWQGPHALPPYARAVFTVLAMKVRAADFGDEDERTRRISEANKRIGDLAEGYSKKHSTQDMDFSWVDKSLEEAMRSPRLSRLQMQHAYVFTVFATLLQITRRLNGVQASASFLWLKPVDRTLFYVLNNVGRQDAYHVEACAPLTHWLAEKTYQRALLTPRIDSSIEGIKKALSQFKDDDFEDTIYL